MKRKIYLMYHAIKPSYMSEENTLLDTAYTISEEVFREQMEVLSEAIKSGELRNDVIITFDDGHISDLLVAAPILKKLNIKGVSFVTVGLVGKSKYLDWATIKEMIDLGIEVGSHGITHNPLSSMDKLNVLREMKESKAILESKIGIVVDKFACPGGFYNNTVIKSAKESGYKEIHISDVGINNNIKPFSIIKRIAIRPSYDLQEFTNIIHYKKSTICKLIILDYAKKTIKKLFPSKIYRILKGK